MKAARWGGCDYSIQSLEIYTLLYVYGDLMDDSHNRMRKKNIWRTSPIRQRVIKYLKNISKVNGIV